MKKEHTIEIKVGDQQPKGDPIEIHNVQELFDAGANAETEADFWHLIDNLARAILQYKAIKEAMPKEEADELKLDSFKYWPDGKPTTNQQTKLDLDD